MKLLNAEIIRDGGSLTASFERDDGSLLSLHLQIGPDGLSAPPPHYRQLITSFDVRPEDGDVVCRGGNLEARLFADLDHWLAEPRFSSDWSRAESEHARMAEQVADLRRGAAERIDSEI